MAQKYLDYKCTTWCRLKFSDSVDLKKVKKLIKDGFTPNEIPQELGDFDAEWEYLNDVEEFMYPEDNGNSSTIELFNGIKMIYNNSIKE